MLRLNDPAPPFELPGDGGTNISLKSLAGKPVVLFFYPKDDTPGCTVEACDFRDAFPRFRGAGATILGISPDDVVSHRKFKRKFELPYTLLADTGLAVAEKYGVWKEKSLYGRTYMGVERTTFLIDGKGRIAQIFENVNPEGHADEVAAAIAALP